MVLATGGNAIEAMVAMAATIAVVYPHMNHVGGDGFWLVREPPGRVRAFMAAGRAGAHATRDRWVDTGARGGARTWRTHAAARAPCGWDPPCEGGVCRHPWPSPAHAGEA